MALSLQRVYESNQIFRSAYRVWNIPPITKRGSLSEYRNSKRTPVEKVDREAPVGLNRAILTLFMLCLGIVSVAGFSFMVEIRDLIKLLAANVINLVRNKLLGYAFRCFTYMSQHK